MSDELKEKVFVTIQKFLNKPPVIIWGSGATVSFGLPTMGDLNNELKRNIDNFNPSDENLEIELGKPEYDDKLPQIRKIIWNSVNKADQQVREKVMTSENDIFDSIKKIIEKFRSTHPKVVNIVTTNYDRVLEHIMGFYEIPYTDGFGSHEFNQFNNNLFLTKDITNVVKVHGSLNWFQVDGNIRYLMIKYDNAEPVIIPPGKNKYQEAYKSPYRELIQKSDNLINDAASLLVVGFGFNDEHLTPKIREKVNNGTPLVLITKEITKSCRKELEKAQKYILLQKNTDKEQTSVSLKTGKNDSEEEFIIDGNYWQLSDFMEVI